MTAADTAEGTPCSCRQVLLAVVTEDYAIFSKTPRAVKSLCQTMCVSVNSTHTHTITWHGLAAAAALEGKATNLGKVVVHVSSSQRPG